eukprot:Lankesteria_metandrocarpae@DN4694_c0_g1_i1.p2
MTRLKPSAIRKKTSAEQTTDLDALRQELSQLRTSQIVNPMQSKLNKIRVVRKNIARVLTILHEDRLAKAKEHYKGQKWVPKQIRKKGTRAERRALPEHLKNKQSLRKYKKSVNLPRRKYAVLAAQ